MHKPRLDDARRRWYEASCQRIDAERLKRLIVDLTSIHSPTGAEARAARFMARHFEAMGLRADFQQVSADSANCVGRLPGSGEGPSLLLYAPIDTHLDADPERDVPWAGKALRADMVPQATVIADTVIGLGASNPKSMLATLVEAVQAVMDAGVALKGDVLVATAGGGMPWVVEERGRSGMSSGVRHLLGQGLAADYGIIFKPWDEVYYEHPGLCWLKITVTTAMGYAGIPRGVPGFESSILPAAELVLSLEDWLTAYPEAHCSAQVRPEGWISAIRAGWPDKPAFPSAATEIYLDIRTNPDQTSDQLLAEIEPVLARARSSHREAEFEVAVIADCQASRTDPDSWIVQSCIRAWEERRGVPYPGPPPLAGQTDAAALAASGLPLARIGYPYPGTWPDDVPADLARGIGGLGVAHVPDLVDPCKALIYALIDTCTRSVSEIAELT